MAFWTVSCANSPTISPVPTVTFLPTRRTIYVSGSAKTEALPAWVMTALIVVFVVLALILAGVGFKAGKVQQEIARQRELASYGEEKFEDIKPAGVCGNLLFWKDDALNEEKLELPSAPSPALGKLLTKHQLTRLEKKLMDVGAYAPQSLLDLRDYHVELMSLEAGEQRRLNDALDELQKEKDDAADEQRAKEERAEVEESEGPAPPKPKADVSNAKQAPEAEAPSAAKIIAAEAEAPNPFLKVLEESKEAAPEEPTGAVADEEEPPPADEAAPILATASPEGAAPTTDPSGVVLGLFGC